MSAPSVSVKLSANAQSALAKRQTPLNIELELYFSCLIRLRVLFPDSAADDFIPLDSGNDRLKLFFHPVMTKHCVVDEIRGHAPDTETFPIKKPDKFIPKWVTLDFRHGQWSGEFGYK
ncbi:MAG: hypothetical protein PVG89_15130 [Gammaproteobacteria bacterium]|jgi:hypothetical protein